MLNQGELAAHWLDGPGELASDGLAIGGGANGKPFVVARLPPTRATSRSQHGEKIAPIGEGAIRLTSCITRSR
ncbi:hypothetical protein JP74_14960 [Devosia sp. 17-2-E-8]|nr:hypothetical protein [Brucella intermedia]KFL26197.1 hypothetical protein JP74_14960 [Devosia sp. 17-2-E-8]WGG59384.1 hypothetical protein QA414_00155 [Brucella intermedia]